MCFCLVTGLVPACHEATANLPPKIIPTKIAGRKLSGKSPVGPGNSTPLELRLCLSQTL